MKFNIWCGKKGKNKHQEGVFREWRTLMSTRFTGHQKPRHPNRETRFSE